MLGAAFSDGGCAGGDCELLDCACDAHDARPAKTMIAEIAFALYVDIPFFLRSSVTWGFDTL